MLTFVQIQFKNPSRQMGRLLSNCLSNMRLVKASLKNALFFQKKFIFLSGYYGIRDKTLTVTFRAQCIASGKLLLPPLLCKLLIGNPLRKKVLNKV